MSGHATDAALLLLRLALGPMLVAHGYQKVFAGGKLAGTAGWFESLGLRPGWLHARLAATTELGAGTLITVGLLTPAAGAAFVGLMTVAAFTDHRGKGFFVFKGGWEYVCVVAIVAVALATLGPGRWSLDHAIGHFDTPCLPQGIFAAAVGLAGACALLAAFYRAAPPAP
jgi:putative oxidoreductase